MFKYMVPQYNNIIVTCKAEHTILRTYNYVHVLELKATYLPWTLQAPLLLVHIPHWHITEA